MAKNDLEVAGLVGRVFVTLAILGVVLALALALGTGLPDFLGR